MAEKKNSSHKSAVPGAPQNTKKGLPSQGRISGLMEHLHAKEMFYLLGGVCQFLLGISVIFISIMGLIHPFALSVGLNILAIMSISTGIYFCYHFFNDLRKKNLLRDAMRRIIEDQN